MTNPLFDHGLIMVMGKVLDGVTAKIMDEELAQVKDEQNQEAASSAIIGGQSLVTHKDIHIEQNIVAMVATEEGRSRGSLCRSWKKQWSGKNPKGLLAFARYCTEVHFVERNGKEYLNHQRRLMANR